MRILLIESDRARARALQTRYAPEGLELYLTDLLEDAVDLAVAEDYAACLVSEETETLRPAERVAALRAGGTKIPLLVLARNASVAEKIACLSRGADEVVDPKTPPEELRARIEAVWRRIREAEKPGPRHLGPVLLDPDRGAALLGDQLIHLSAKEFRALWLLTETPGRVVTRETLFEHLYGPTHPVELRIIDILMLRARKKLRCAGAPDGLIQIVHGRGYRFSGNPTL